MLPRNLKATDVESRLQNLTYLLDEFILDVAEVPGDLNPACALILGRLVLNGAPMSHGELLRRGIYPGTNVSYNLARLVKSSYLQSKRDPNDGRAVRLILTDKGREVGTRVAKVLGYIDEYLGQMFDDQRFRQMRDWLVNTVHEPIRKPASKSKAA